MKDAEDNNRYLVTTTTLLAEFKARLESDPEFRKQVHDAAEAVAIGIERMRSVLASVGEQVANGIVAFRSACAGVIEQAAPVLADLAAAFKLLPEAMQTAISALAEEGWFISPGTSLSEPAQAAKLFLAGERKKGNRHLVSCFQRNLDDIEKAIVEALPGRAALISSAFAAHRCRQFELAIPVFLAQADGICSDLADGSLFQSERSNRKARARPETAAFVDDFEHDMFWRILLSPLGRKIPLNFTANERPENFTGLNRHLVMHGESLDYGTEINSLKCISLLTYLTWVLRDSKGRR